MPISKVGVKIGELDEFASNNVSFSMNTHRDSTGMPILQNLQTAIVIQVDMYDQTNMPFKTIKGLFELAKLPSGSNIKEVEIHFWSDDAGKDVICNYHFKGWITRYETYTAPGSNGILSLELCPVINQKTGANVDISK